MHIYDIAIFGYALTLGSFSLLWRASSSFSRDSVPGQLECGVFYFSHKGSGTTHIYLVGTIGITEVL